MNQQKTKKSQQSQPPKTQYRKYDRKRRLRLIQMVQKQNKSLASSAKQLGIPQTTARLILKTWREENRVFQKKVDRIKREKKEAIKQSQAKRKEKQRLKKLARRQLSTNSTPEGNEEPLNEIKTEQNQSQLADSLRVEICQQIPLQPIVGYNSCIYQTPFVYVYPQLYYF